MQSRQTQLWIDPVVVSVGHKCRLGVWALAPRLVSSESVQSEFAPRLEGQNGLRRHLISWSMVSITLGTCTLGNPLQQTVCLAFVHPSACLKVNRGRPSSGETMLGDAPLLPARIGAQTAAIPSAATCSLLFSLQVALPLSPAASRQIAEEWGLLLQGEARYVSDSA